MDEKRSTRAQQDAGSRLDVERIIAAAPEATFDAFIALYDRDRPDWVTSSHLDLRPGGRWPVGFDVPNGSAFQEERVLTAVERPRRRAYDVRAVVAGAPDVATHVELTIDAVPDGQRVRLVQRGFPTTRLRDEFAGAWPGVLDELAARVSASGPSVRWNR